MEQTLRLLGFHAPARPVSNCSLLGRLLRLAAATLDTFLCASLLLNLGGDLLVERRDQALTTTALNSYPTTCS